MTIKQQFERMSDQINQWLERYPIEKKNLLIQWLEQHFYLAQNVSRYLALSASLVGSEGTEEFNWWLRCLSHQKDVDALIKEDLYSLGQRNIAPMSPFIRGIILATHADILKNGSDSLVGYSLLMECLSGPQCQALANKVYQNYGIRSQFLSRGSYHTTKYPEVLTRAIQFNPERKELVLENLAMTKHIYKAFLDDLLSKASPATESAPAPPSI